jgi:hypothetical protein
MCILHRRKVCQVVLSSEYAVVAKVCTALSCLPQEILSKPSKQVKQGPDLRAPSPPRLPAAVCGTLAGGALLDRLGGTLRSAVLVCALGVGAGALLIFLAFGACQSFGAFCVMLALGEFAVFIAEVGCWMGPGARSLARQAFPSIPACPRAVLHWVLCSLGWAAGACMALGLCMVFHGLHGINCAGALLP